MFVASTGIAMVSLASCAVVHVDVSCCAHARFDGAVRLSLAPALPTSTPESSTAPRRSRICRIRKGYDGHPTNTDRYAVERRNESNVTTDARGLHRPRQPDERDRSQSLHRE